MCVYSFNLVIFILNDEHAKFCVNLHVCCTGVNQSSVFEGSEGACENCGEWIAAVNFDKKGHTYGFFTIQGSPSPSCPIKTKAKPLQSTCDWTLIGSYRDGNLRQLYEYARAYQRILNPVNTLWLLSYELLIGSM